MNCDSALEAVPDQEVHVVSADYGGPQGSPPRNGTKRLSPREARRQQQLDTYREQVLDAAEALFAAHGYRDTGLKDVATRCELSVGTIYSLFKNKEHLYEAVLLRHGDEQVAETNERAPASLAPDQRLIELARMQIDYMSTHPQWNAVHADAAGMAMRPNGTIPRGYQTYVENSITYLAEIIEQGQNEGVVQQGDPTTLARLFFTLLNSFVTMDIGDKEAKNVARIFEDLVRRAFSTR